MMQPSPITRSWQKGRTGFPHLYLRQDTGADVDHPWGQTGPDERIYTLRIGVASTNPHRHEPLDMAERKLRVKMRDRFQCVRCGATTKLHVHHTKGPGSHRPKTLVT